MLTIEFLKEQKTSKEIIKWLTNNKLINMPFDILSEVKGDYKNYFLWLRGKSQGTLKPITSTSYTYKEEFDERGNSIYFEDSNGYKCWKDFDENDNETYFVNSDKDEIWRTYDDKSNLLYLESSSGYREWFTYDDHNNVLTYRNTADKVENFTNGYYADGQLKSIICERYGELYIPYFEK